MQQQTWPPTRANRTRVDQCAGPVVSCRTSAMILATSSAIFGRWRRATFRPCRLMPSMRPKSWVERLGDRRCQEHWQSAESCTKRHEGYDYNAPPKSSSIITIEAAGKSPAAMLGEAECASGKPGERRRHVRYPCRSPPLPHFDVFASAAFSAARAPARMLAMA
jgi:hypothetical protein